MLLKEKVRKIGKNLCVAVAESLSYKDPELLGLDVECCGIFVSFCLCIRRCPILFLGVWFPFFPARFIGGGRGLSYPACMFLVPFL